MSPNRSISKFDYENDKNSLKPTERSRTDLLAKAVLASDAEVNSVCGCSVIVCHLVVSEIEKVRSKMEKGRGGK